MLAAPARAGGGTVEPAAPEVEEIRDQLLAWYGECRRDLPWRRTPDPYAVWISEVMLQQTRVATVEPYFERWMRTYPDVFSLAASSLQDVLGAWQGLGYYGRARNLHRAARIVTEQHGGALPTSHEGWLALPGIGPYTAGAVASIACGEAVAAVDGNARRALARLMAIEGDPSRPPAAGRIAAIAAALARGPRPGDLNQAVMELGATVCTAEAPRCADCPVGDHCRARRLGRERQIPATPKRVPPQTARWLAVAACRARDDVEWFLARRPEAGLLGGLWEFPMADGIASRDRMDDVRRLVRDLFDVEADTVAARRDVRHAFTHVAVTVTPFVASIPASVTAAPGSRCVATVATYIEWRWVPEPTLPELPRSRLMDKILHVVRAGGSELEAA